jgi:hypothetical protein
MKQRARKSSKPCPYPECAEHISRQFLLCWSHWSALPMSMQDEMTEALRKQGMHVAVKLRDSAIGYLQRRTAKISGNAGGTDGTEAGDTGGDGAGRGCPAGNSVASGDLCEAGADREGTGHDDREAGRGDDLPLASGLTTGNEEGDGQ